MKHLSIKEKLISALHRRKNKQRKKRPCAIDYDSTDESLRSVGDIAESIGIRRHSLSRYFAIVLKEDPRTWIVQRRIDMAKDMLLQYPDCSATIIGDSVGFSDRSNFARQFKKHTGMTPGEWRERDLIKPGEKNLYSFHFEKM